MISIGTVGSFDSTRRYLHKLSRGDFYPNLDGLAREGVAALSRATPIESSRAANSWDYTIQRERGSVTITWLNHDIEEGFPVVIMLQYGHGTGTGGYVQGQDFINPAIRPIFNKIDDAVRKAVTSV